MMKQLSVYFMDAFTKVPFAGNTAGVVPDAGGLTDAHMQQIANELNLPESAFILPATHPQADVKVRYFTPTEEINFCGHATVGSTWLLATKYGWQNRVEQIVLETNVGLIPVKLIKENGQLTSVSMTQIPPQTREFKVDHNRIVELAGIKPEDLDERYPIKLSNTGNWHLLVPVKTRSAIDSAVPQFRELGNMNREHGISTTHLFTFDTEEVSREEKLDLYTRDFAPGIGIPEDPVTGAANGALAGYLVKEGLLDPTETHQLVIGQGHAINRPGTLYVTIRPNGDQPIIEVAGSAVVTIEGKLNLDQA